jgi:hypothetical protein
LPEFPEDVQAVKVGQSEIQENDIEFPVDQQRIRSPGNPGGLVPGRHDGSLEGRSHGIVVLDDQQFHLAGSLFSSVSIRRTTSYGVPAPKPKGVLGNPGLPLMWHQSPVVWLQSSYFQDPNNIEEEP